VAVLSGRYRLSRREVAGVCREVLGAPLAVGSVDALCHATAAALAEPVAALEAAVQQASAAHADETSWRQAGQRCWLWVVVTALVTVFTIAPSRGRGVIQGLLGAAFAGYLITDRWSAYTWLSPERRQVCWAHLKRDFQALVDAGGSARAIGETGGALIDRLFDAWYAGRDEPTPRPALAAALAPLQAEFHTLLEQGQRSGHYKAMGLCESLLKLEPALWTFITVAGVAPTNNAAEQALRPAVLWRKGSFGTQSAGGNMFVTRMLSVAATCKQQQRSLLDYLTAVCTAAQHGQPIPSLLPGTQLAHVA
jgi:transposase